MLSLCQKIMDKYWVEFVLSDNFEKATSRYEYAMPLEACFWGWFKETYLAKPQGPTLEDLLK